MELDVRRHRLHKRVSVVVETDQTHVNPNGKRHRHKDK
jgi:hypothetical protein